MIVLIVASTLRGIGYAWDNSETVLLLGVVHCGPGFFLIGQPEGFSNYSLDISFEDVSTHFTSTAFWGLPKASTKVFVLPLGPAMFFAGIIWILTRIVHKRPRNPMGCMSCGYDLTGNQSGVCPECGQAIGESA